MERFSLPLAGAMAAAVLLSPVALAESNCGPDGMQDSGSIYRICMPAPEDYNGRLVLWAHGFQDAGTPVGIPEDQLSFGGVSLPALINDLGFGFATNSYSKTGLAVRQGMADLLDLIDIYSAEQGEPEKVYLTGASEGGIITALLVELYPGRFDGGVAACGPVGDFAFQIAYFGDARVTFDFFFPGLIPGDPLDPQPDLVAMWSDFYRDHVRPAILAPENRDRLAAWVRVAHLPFDPRNYLESVEISARDVLRYSIVNFQDAVATLGGMPYSNRWRIYHGSGDDLALNLSVPRIDASPLALHEMDEHYDTSGVLRKPLMTLHTRLDQQVPYVHESIYNLKTLFGGSLITRHLNFPVNRFEHCNFTAEEAILAFGAMLLYAGDAELLPGLIDLLPEPQQRQLEALAAGLDPWRHLVAAPSRSAPEPRAGRPTGRGGP